MTTAWSTSLNDSLAKEATPDSIEVIDERTEVTYVDILAVDNHDTLETARTSGGLEFCDCL